MMLIVSAAQLVVKFGLSAKCRIWMNRLGLLYFCLECDYNGRG